MISRVKGTQDFINTSLINFIISQITKHLNEYNFKEVIVPILEYVELFKRSLGTHTDVVSKEMFLIETKGREDDQICLRPEATASVVRAFLENQITQTPWKIYTYGSMFRYERPQKGRFREFHQFNIEIIGSKSIYQDAYFIKMLDKLFKDKFFLDNYAVLVNFLGCYEDRKKFELELRKFLDTVSNKICENCLERREKNPLRIFDCKVPEDNEIYRNAPHTTDHLCKICDEEWKLLHKTLELISVSFSHSYTLVRGLDYYDKTVFEFVSENLGSQNAFCGGGRYDRLIKDISQGLQDQPSIGAAIGLERIMILLATIKDKLPLEQLAPLFVILPLSSKQHLLALLLANQLHANSLTCDILLEDASVKSLMRKANKMGAKYLLIVGENEQAQREVTLKNMLTGEEKIVKQSELLTNLQQYI